MSAFKKALCNRKSDTDVVLRPSLNTISRQKTKGGWGIKRGKCNIKKRLLQTWESAFRDKHRQRNGKTPVRWTGNSLIFINLGEPTSDWLSQADKRDVRFGVLSPRVKMLTELFDVSLTPLTPGREEIRHSLLHQILFSSNSQRKKKKGWCNQLMSETIT